MRVRISTLSHIGSNHAARRKPKPMTTIYTLSATAIDSNGVRVMATAAEVLGEYCGKKYLTSEAAQEARDEAEELAREYYPTAVVTVDASEVEDKEVLVKGDRYDVASVRAAGWTLEDAGYQLGDYFDVAGRYLGPDQHGIEPIPGR